VVSAAGIQPSLAVKCLQDVKAARGPNRVAPEPKLSAAFGWRSAFSAAINALLEMRALAPEVPKPSETNPGKLTTRTANRLPRPHLRTESVSGHLFSDPPNRSGRARLQSCLKHSGRRAALAAADNATIFYERPMNSGCGKPTRHPRIKPVIAGDTTYGVSLLTGTISGSNFAIP
jgi:hypothetical protein